MRYRAQFPAVRTSALGARRFVSETLGDVPDQVSESIILVASELATNAMRHAGSAFEIRIEQLPDRIHIEVEDDGGGQPVVRSPGLYDTSGRGLQIVEELADEWGVIPKEETGGKVVWATIPLRTSPDHLLQTRHDEAGRDPGRQKRTGTGTAGPHSSVRPVGDGGWPNASPRLFARSRAGRRRARRGHSHGPTAEALLRKPVV
jgi:anti-sigma regulatory factor (Ser/Thr protein kinase)